MNSTLLRVMSRLAACQLAACLLLAGSAKAHDFLGANLNGVADFSRNHEFVDVMKQARKFGSFADPFNTVIAVGPDGWPAGDFGVTLFAAQSGVIGLTGTYKMVFNGAATVTSVVAPASVSNRTYNAGLNETRYDLVLPSGSDTVALRFAVDAGPATNAVKNLRVIRPGFDPDNHPTFTPAFLNHVGRFRVLRFMDWLVTNHDANNIVGWADRFTFEKKRTEAEGAHWETIVELANTTNRDIWINIPVRANDEYVTNLATQLRDTLNPNVNVYVEYSNELWNFAFDQFQIQKDLAIAEVTANPSSVLKFDGTNDQNQWAFRRTGKRLKEISDIFKTVWGPAAINGRVRVVLAGQMANDFIVGEGLRVVDEGMNVRPRDVFYALSGAPYVFPSATNDSQEDEVPGLTVDDLIAKITAGVNNAPSEASYKYQSHLALGAWYGLKVVAYEGGFDTFGGQNIANKRLANLDPRIRTQCQNLLNAWHASGFETFMWFNAGAASYDTQFGQWPLLEDMQDTAKPKNQCMDDILATPLPALTAGTPLTAPVAGGNFLGSANPTGTLTNVSGPFGFPGYAQYLLRADQAGTYKLTFLAKGNIGDQPKIGVQLNGDTVAASFLLPESNTFVTSQAITVQLRKGVNALRFIRPPAAGTWTVQSFSLDIVAGARSDFNADGKSDILWHNSATGALYELQMNGFAQLSGAGTAGIVDQQADLNWKVVAVADLNGDGKADVVWQNGATGEVQALLMNGLAVAAEGTVYVEPNTHWKIFGAGDFNGDGKADLLWRNDQTGDVFMLLMNGLAVTGGGVIYSEPNQNWQIQKVADFNADGKADILWRNVATGDVFVLLMNGASIVGGGVIYSEPNQSWQIQAAADFNGDGKSDILWRNIATGDVFMMLMNGATITGGSVFYGEPDTNWKIVATGDYNGDGRADILWRNSASGQVYMMLMNGAAIASANFVYFEPDQAWKILGP